MADQKNKQTKPKVAIVKKKESKHDLFLRLAKARTEKVLKSIKILSNCSNSSYYEYSEKEITKIFESINQAVVKALNKFMNTKEQTTFEF